MTGGEWDKPRGFVPQRDLSAHGSRSPSWQFWKQELENRSTFHPDLATIVRGSGSRTASCRSITFIRWLCSKRLLRRISLRVWKDCPLGWQCWAPAGEAWLLRGVSGLGRASPPETLRPPMDDVGVKQNLLRGPFVSLPLSLCV